MFDGGVCEFLAFLPASEAGEQAGLLRFGPGFTGKNED